MKEDLSPVKKTNTVKFTDIISHTITREVLMLHLVHCMSGRTLYLSLVLCILYAVVL